MWGLLSEKEAATSWQMNVPVREKANEQEKKFPFPFPFKNNNKNTLG